MDHPALVAERTTWWGESGRGPDPTPQVVGEPVTPNLAVRGVGSVPAVHARARHGPDVVRRNEVEGGL